MSFIFNILTSECGPYALKASGVSDAIFFFMNIFNYQEKNKIHQD
jgi:hypothetical protein